MSDLFGEPIESFRGHYGWLSNFWRVDVVYMGEVYPSVEHAYQAAKCTSEKDRQIIKNCASPALAKKTSRILPIISKWEEVREGIMLYLLREKFKKEPFKTMLIETGQRELIEGNTWEDTFWGICNGKGKNILGKLLMKVREEVKITGFRCEICMQLFQSREELYAHKKESH